VARVAGALVPALLLAPAGCWREDGQAESAALFEAMPQDLAAMECGRPGCATILESVGGGAALFDADGDGDVDLLLVIPGPYPAPGAEGGRTSRLYRNDGGRFVDVTAGSGVDLPGFCGSAAVADVDGDGLRDVYVTRLGGNALLRNLGGCRFEELPEAAGAAAGGWSSSALFVDIDRDGDMDLYVANYVVFDPARPPLHAQDGRLCVWMGVPVFCGPQGLQAEPDRFYLNEGGRFTEATAERGFAARASFGLGVVDGDWNADGWPDVYVTNDSMPNFLFLSRGDGTVRESGVLAGAALSARGHERAGMGIAVGDCTGDGEEELLVTNFSLESTSFYVNRGRGRFCELGDASGLGGPSRMLLGWGSAFLDADLDGDLDAVTANGHVYPQADNPDTGTRFEQPDMLWLNDGQGHFAVARWPGEAPAVSRALAAGDIDDDGATDLVITRLHGPPAVWRGQADGRRSVRVRLVGGPGNPDACGAVLRLRDARGERTWRVRSAGGFQACNDPRPVLAWRGPAELEVAFPGGRTERRAVPAPGVLTVAENGP